MTNQTSKIDRLEAQLKKATEDIRELSDEVQTKSAALGREKERKINYLVTYSREFFLKHI